MKKLKQSIWAKITAYVLICLLAIVFLISAVVVLISYNEGLYEYSKESQTEKAIHSYIEDKVYYAVYAVVAGEEPIEIDKNTTYTIYGPDGSMIANTWDADKDTEYYKFEYEIPVGRIENEKYTYQVIEKGQKSYGLTTTEETTPEQPTGGDYITEDFDIYTYVDRSLPEKSVTHYIEIGVELAYYLRYAVYVILPVTFLLAVLLFSFLISAAGHKKGQDGIKVRGLAKIPLDLHLVGIVSIVLFMLANMYWVISYAMVERSIALLGVMLLSVNFFTCLAVNIKVGSWWHNTIIWKVLSLLKTIFLNINLIAKTVLVVGVITLLEFFFIAMLGNPRVLWLWIISRVIIIPAVFYMAIMLNKLKTGAEKIVSGQINGKIDASKMFWDFKKHAETLNNINKGLGTAVDKQMKSERMKTELITNVSHDIKTPLTSIINYVDLIGKEETDNEKIAEYSEILAKQSNRLKRLIEDLVEASKATSGNMDINLEPCEIGVLLTQSVGEYEQKMQEKELELITKNNQESVFIMADGKLLWRVFDNLLNNVCKYAQSGTRVYINLEIEANKAVISFKNTSKYPLNISADELLERFVRGEKSRHTEGNGLGLSIAQSLVELQYGSMQLVVDGDLFKVILEFELKPEDN